MFAYCKKNKTKSLKSRENKRWLYGCKDEGNETDWCDVVCDAVCDVVCDILQDVVCDVVVSGVVE